MARTMALSQHLLDQVFNGDNGAGIGPVVHLNGCAPNQGRDSSTRTFEQAIIHGLDTNNVTGDVPAFAEPFLAEMEESPAWPLGGACDARLLLSERTEGVLRCDRVVGGDVARWFWIRLYLSATATP